MILSRSGLLAVLDANGVPTTRARGAAADEINGATFGTIDPAWVSASWDAWIAADMGTRLVVPRDIGGGKTRLVPNYVDPGYVCRHATIRFYAHLLAGLALRATVTPQPFDAYALGPVYYTAEPRADDLNRDGRHARILFVGDDGLLHQFEEGDGDPEPMTPAELASISLWFVT